MLAAIKTSLHSIAHLFFPQLCLGCGRDTVQSNEPICIEHGERIAQMVLTHYFNIEWNTVKTLNKTERGEGGFGHTGVN